ncbi:MAG: methylated-DNA--[protein]-cysteine S-methyltransferase [Candidatus Zixiibacteriota bacterium]
MNLLMHSFVSPYGTIRTAELDERLAFIALPTVSDSPFKMILTRTFPEVAIDMGGKLNREAERQLQAYFSGKLTRFDLDLEWYGTPFQRQVLKEVAAIKYGSTRSYGEIARRIGSPGASRAVGTVNARNRIPLVIPCHRVVASGGLGGYGGGLDMKRKLLTLEGVLGATSLPLSDINHGEQR